MNSRIKKVKLEANKIRIEYLVPVTGQKERDELSLLCATPAKQSFYDALTSLVPFVAEICEQSEKWAQSVEVRGVSFSYGGENEVMGATISALKTLEKSNSPLVINTPHKSSEPYNEGGDETICLSDEATDALYHLQRETQLYLDGHRAQLSLEFEGDKPSELPAPALDSTPVTFSDSDLKKIGEIGKKLKSK